MDIERVKAEARKYMQTAEAEVKESGESLSVLAHDRKYSVARGIADSSYTDDESITLWADVNGEQVDPETLAPKKATPQSKDPKDVKEAPEDDDEVGEQYPSAPEGDDDKDDF